MNYKDRSSFLTKSAERGFTLLMAIIAGSILLSLALGIFAVAYRDTLFAALFRHSQIAFAAADRGVECALYWDAGFPQNGWTYTAFATSSYYHTPAAYPPRLCNIGGMDVDITASEWSEVRATPPTLAATTTFTLYFSNGSCAKVRVVKTPSDPVVRTRILSDGYNTYDRSSTIANCDLGSTRRTQRTLEVHLGN